MGKHIEQCLLDIYRYAIFIEHLLWACCGKHKVNRQNSWPSQGLGGVTVGKHDKLANVLVPLGCRNRAIKLGGFKPQNLIQKSELKRCGQDWFLLKELRDNSSQASPPAIQQCL